MCMCVCPGNLLFTQALLLDYKCICIHQHHHHHRIKLLAQISLTFRLAIRFSHPSLPAGFLLCIHTHMKYIGSSCSSNTYTSIFRGSIGEYC